MPIGYIMKFLVTGLGNIGAEYELTRHNIGFLTLDRLVDKSGLSFKQDRQGSISEYKYKGRSIILLKPSTYMNLSGKAINYWLQQLKIPVENSLVVTDDLALPLGKLRMRKKGSDAGHNGLKNIEQMLGTSEYPRLKFGIGDDFHKGQQIDYVLGRFTQEEFDVLPAIMDKAIDMIHGFCTIGIDRTMNQYND